MVYLSLSRWFLMWFSFAGLPQESSRSMNFTTSHILLNFFFLKLEMHSASMCAWSFIQNMPKNRRKAKYKKEILNERNVRISFVIALASKWYRNSTIRSTRNPFNMHTNEMGIIKNLIATIKMCVSFVRQVNALRFHMETVYAFSFSFQLNALSVLCFTEKKEIEQFWLI